MADQAPFTVLLRFVVEDRSSGARGARKNVDGLSDSFEGLNRQVSLWVEKRVGEELRRGGDAIVAGFAGAVKKAATLERSLAAVELIVARNGENFGELKDKLLAVGAEMEQTPQEILQMATEAARAGVSFNELTDSVKSAAKFTIASGTAYEGMVTDMEKIRAQTRLSSKEFEAFQNTLVTLSQTSPVNPKFLIQAGVLSGELATQSGLTKGSFLGMLSAISVAIPRPLRASTALNRVMAEMANPKRFETIARVSGKSLAEVEASARKGGEGIKELFLATFQGLNKLDFVDVGKELDELGLAQKENISGMRRLVTTFNEPNGLLDVFNRATESFDGYTQGIGGADALNRAFNKNVDTLTGSMNRLRGEWDLLNVGIGELFAPFLKDVINLLRDFLVLLNENPAIRNTVGVIILGAGAVGSMTGRIIEWISALALIQIAMRQAGGSTLNFLSLGELFKGFGKIVAAPFVGLGGLAKRSFSTIRTGVMKIPGTMAVATTSTTVFGKALTFMGKAGKLAWRGLLGPIGVLLFTLVPILMQVFGVDLVDVFKFVFGALVVWLKVILNIFIIIINAVIFGLNALIGGYNAIVPSGLEISTIPYIPLTSIGGGGSGDAGGGSISSTEEPRVSADTLASGLEDKLQELGVESEPGAVADTAAQNLSASNVDLKSLLNQGDSLVSANATAQQIIINIDGKKVAEVMATNNSGAGNRASGTRSDMSGTGTG